MVMKIAGIYLAAGEAKRMGKRKVSEELTPGVCLGSPGLRELLSCSLDRVVVVARPGDPLEWLPPELLHRDAGCEFTVVFCEDASKGMSCSLQCGLKAVMPSAPDAVVVTLADQPFVTAKLLKGLLRSVQGNPSLDYAVSGHGDQLMPPAVLSHSMFAAIGRLEGDQGAKRLFSANEYKGAVHNVAVPQTLMDVDTPKDLEVAKNYWKHYFCQDK